eukprot:6180487-Pleurochrysis_carterae.AAC.3
MAQAMSDSAQRRRRWTTRRSIRQQVAAHARRTRGKGQRIAHARRATPHGAGKGQRTAQAAILGARLQEWTAQGAGGQAARMSAKVDSAGAERGQRKAPRAVRDGLQRRTFSL